ncbi:reverse transcriptase domain-containing protein [Tanacetum coccineum]
MGLPPYHRYRCCQFLLMKLEFFYVEVLKDMKIQGHHLGTSHCDGRRINTLHLVGLLSDSGVHSRLDQLQLLLNGASERGAKKIRVHVLTDGRDVLDGSSVGLPETLEAELASLRNKGIDAQVASGGGRMYVTMDRYEDEWEVVKRGWDAQVLGEAPHKKVLVYNLCFYVTALVLNDRGICCIDGFDKMSENARSMLHEQVSYGEEALTLEQVSPRCINNPITSRADEYSEAEQLLKIPNLDPPAGIFANHLRSLFECDFVSLDSRLNSKKSTMDHSFGSAEEVDHVRILQSCNGLLLCSAIVYLDWHLIIENQVTTKWCKLEAKLNDAFYWLEGLNRELKHCKLNMEDHDHPIMTSLEIAHGLHRGRNFLESFGGPINDPILLLMEIPHMLHLEGKFFESCECLLLVVNIVQLLNPLPEGWSIRTGVWNICLGEGEENVFVVINLSGKVVQYNLISKTNTEIFDIGSNQMDDDDDDAVVFIPPFEVDPNLYEFISSLASV